ncbi:Fur family transcriptional regulator [Sinomonas gamaensis]|uniref:Fur family transcriptional regulator n=1 Tax=Sinomonas gamaensis TaxID=2565624 RepID=UPI001107AF1F|nr:Fur family transcriptional regulator [Sinomonas gamaensis]
MEPTHGPGREQSAQDWSSALREHGRRVTRQRLAVLDAVDRHPHSSADAILASAREDLPELTPQSVYVVLGDLTDLGMLRRFEPPHSPALYETRVGDNHHHAICSVCGRVEDVDCAVGHAPCLTPSDAHGMTIMIADVTYVGVCSDCAAKASQAPAT